MAMKRMWSKGQVKNLSKEVIESGLVENAKPIYCHPLDINFTSGSRVGCLIFNNDPTPFTSSTFADYIEELYAKIGSIIRIITTGVLVISNTIYPATILARRDSSPLYRLISKDTNGDDVRLDFADKTAFISSIDTLTENSLL